MCRRCSHERVQLEMHTEDLSGSRGAHQTSQRRQARVSECSLISPITRDIAHRPLLSLGNALFMLFQCDSLTVDSGVNVVDMISRLLLIL